MRCGLEATQTKCNRGASDGITGCQPGLSIDAPGHFLDPCQTVVNFFPEQDGLPHRIFPDRLGHTGGMIYAYSNVGHTDFVWLPSVLGDKITQVMMLFAVVLLVLGTMIRNPTSIVWPDAINDEYRGVIKITRHPIQWAIVLYAIAHLISNGDRASIVLFGTLDLVALLGTFAKDAKKRALNDPKWQSFLDSTSNIPFAALLSGRTNLASHDINYLALDIGIALYAGIYWLHAMVSGGLGLC